MATILVRATHEQRDRLKVKAKAAHLSLSGYLLKKGLDDKRTRSTENAATLSDLYAQLIELNQSLKSLPSQEIEASVVRNAIEICQEVGRAIVLYRLARQVEQRS